MEFAHDARKILQNLPMRVSKPVAVLLAIQRRHWKLMAKESAIWLHNVNGDPKTGISGEDMRAEMFQEEIDEDVLDDPMAASGQNGHRDPVEIVIEDPQSTGMPRSYLDGLSEIEFSVSSQASRHRLVAVRWQIDGTHTGTLLGEPASGKQLTVTGLTLLKFSQTLDPEESKTIFTATEEWTCWDLPAVLEQIRGAR
jgi:SnoaL-like polyketide cyclase